MALRVREAAVLTVRGDGTAARPVTRTEFTDEWENVGQTDVFLEIEGDLGDDDDLNKLVDVHSRLDVLAADPSLGEYVPPRASSPWIHENGEWWPKGPG